MAEKKQKQASETANFDSYNYLGKRFLGKMSGLANQYGDLPPDDVFNAYISAGGQNLLLAMPDIQNRRIKRINTRPADYGKNEIEAMISNPDQNEKALREVSAALSWSAKPFDLIQTTYTDMLSYDWFISVEGSQKGTTAETMQREYSLALKTAAQLDIKAKAHEIAGLCMRYGKVFYTPRISLDKSHNKVNYAFFQQLPEDYCKIVGFNNGPGKYTVAFNLMYFLLPGNDWRQFGSLFEPYMENFESVTETGGRYVYSAKNGVPVDTEKFDALHLSESRGSPKWERAGSRWLYWVTLPADKVLTAEIDDRTALVAPPTTGLMVSMTQIPNYEAAQMEIVLNPLTSILTGSLETDDAKGVSTNEDPVRVSPTVRRLFETMWYQMLDKNNTSGIGLFLAPANDLRLQTVSDTVSNTNITGMAISNQITKAGLSSVIPTTDDPKVGVAQLSADIQANYLRPVYWCIERWMNWLFGEMKLKTELRFHMFGNVFDRKELLEGARKGMTLGILPDTLRYDAMMGLNIMEDKATSEFIKKTKLLDYRLPLVSSYSAKQETGGLPPKGDGGLSPEAKHEVDPGGRPPEDGSENAEIHEKLDSIQQQLDELT